jgi:hypothetical protein
MQTRVLMSIKDLALGGAAGIFHGDGTPAGGSSHRVQ